VANTSTVEWNKTDKIYLKVNKMRRWRVVAKGGFANEIRQVG
jgi:hypothetical protein